MAKISKMIDDLTGKTEEEQRLREQFTFLQKMARSKADTFETKLKVMLSNKEATGQLEIVGDRAFQYNNAQHVNISSACDSAIGEAVDDFFSGGDNVKEGFRKIVKHGLSGLIGDTSIGETETHMFFVYPENYSIVRADVMAYKYTFTSKGVLAKDVENIFVYTMAKSIVDHTKVGIDFLLHCVVDMMQKEDGSTPDLKEVQGFIAELKACWKALDECNAAPEEVLESRLSGDAQNVFPSYVDQDMVKSMDDERALYASQSVEELLGPGRGSGSVEEV